MKHLVAALGFASFSLLGFTQQHIDLFSMHYRISPGLEDAVTGEEADFVRFGANLTLPIERENNDKWILGMTYARVDLRYRDDNLTDRTFQPLILKLGYQKQFTEGRSFTFIALPRISSDWKDVDGDHFQYGGLSYYTWKPGTDTRMRLGVYANTEFFGPLFVPLIGIDYYGFKKWSFYGLLPVHYTVAYEAADNLRFGTYFQAIVESYTFEVSGNPGTQLGDQRLYLEHSPQDLYLFGEYGISSFIWLRAQVGHSILRRLYLYDYDNRMDARIAPARIGNDRGDPIQDFEDGLLFQIGLRFRYDLRSN